MKKFLFILLIAFILCAQQIQQDQREVDPLDLDDQDTPIEDSPLQKFLGNLKGAMKRLFDRLYDNFQWADLLDSAMYEGKNIAISLCIFFTGSEDVCNSFVEGIINSLNSE